jgi:hypothetical protein
MLVMPSRKVAWIPVECLVDANLSDNQDLQFNQPLLDALKKANFDSIYVFSSIKYSQSSLTKKIRKKYPSDFDAKLEDQIIIPFKRFLQNKLEVQQLIGEFEPLSLGETNEAEFTRVFIESESLIRSFERYAELEINCLPGNTNSRTETAGTFYFFGTSAIELPNLIDFLARGEKIIKERFRFEPVCVSSKTTREEFLEIFGDNFSQENDAKTRFDNTDIENLTKLLNECRLDLIKYFHTEIQKKKPAQLNKNIFLAEVAKLNLVKARYQIIEELNEAIGWPEYHVFNQFSNNRDANYVLILIKKITDCLESLKRERYQINLAPHDLIRNYIQYLLPVINGISNHRKEEKGKEKETEKEQKKVDELQRILSKAKTNLYLLRGTIETNSSVIIRKPSVLENPVVSLATPRLDNNKSHQSGKNNILSLKMQIQTLEALDSRDAEQEEALSNFYKALFNHLRETFQGEKGKNKAGTKQTYLAATDKRSNLRSFFGFDKRDRKRDITIAEIDVCIKRLSKDINEIDEIDELSAGKTEKEKYQELLDEFAYQKLLTHAYHTSQLTHLFFRTESHLEQTLDKVLAGHLSVNDWEMTKVKFQSKIEEAISATCQSEAQRPGSDVMIAAFGATIKFIFALYMIWMVASDFFAV